MATAEQVQRLKSSWIWLAILGVISLVGGVFALFNPFAATFAAVLLAGWTFLLFGILQVIQAFSIGAWSGFLWALLLGVLTAAVGVSLLYNPLAGALTLTLVVAILFLVLGVVKIMYAISLRPVKGWGWVILSGAISLLLGVLILADYPVSAASILGILLAVELISNGISLLLITFGLRST
ncbi:HdeD family acid-resistance protein [Pseudaminobacter sp. 19-2017]|uniref:HdeD family acid-resistance protein n=1 Tax=Pseudaminobacter soli (ex Zhang et al. 2022) TaxID=2831468 RepID=A0A942I439_9HYPH|nr:HdeD family acid-resistance protein [Pseudaminobacter soli]MBS3651318.1 HdeD family acid-resistance protein [Pseudaminobacter soli]